jgi:hypothetical protein
VCMACEDAGHVHRVPVVKVDGPQKEHYATGRKLATMQGAEFSPPSHELTSRDMGKVYTQIIVDFLASGDEMRWCQRTNGHHSDAIANRLNDRRRKGYPIGVYVLGDKIYIAKV